MTELCIWRCKKCKAELDNTGYRIWHELEQNEIEELDHIFDEPFHCECGCVKEDEDTGEVYCDCEFDPPYSGRQVKECYSELGIPISTNHTNSNFYWNSGGFGEKYGFKIIEILLVAHGSSHNDTIVTVEQKVK